MTLMKAVRIHSYGGPDVLVHEDVQKPEPAQGELLIAVHAAGVNPFDWKVRTGSVKGVRRLPLIPGWDVAGTVESVGAEVSRFKPGDAVFGLLSVVKDGAYAEYAVAKAKNMAFKPRSIDFVHTAALPVSALAAWQSLFDLADLSSGQTVLIHGASGGVGHYAVQLAKWKGARVIGTTSGGGIDFVRDLGADEVIDFRNVRFDDRVRDADVVLDLIGGETQKRSWQVLRKGGILVSSVEITSPDTAARYDVRQKLLMVHPSADELTHIAALIDEGKLKPVVSRVFSLADARKAHEFIQSTDMQGKAVLKIRD